MATAESAPSIVPDAVLEDLRARIRNVHRVRLPDADDWSLGVDANYLDGLLREWADEDDWRDVEARVRALPWVLTEQQELPIRAVHQRAVAPDSAAVVLLHGWPDSILRFSKVLPLLTGVHVVVPALPGYRFAAPLAPSRTSAAAVAKPWRLHRWHDAEGGYNHHQQSTRLNTLAVGLGDSPAGVAAWILEAYWSRERSAHRLLATQTVSAPGVITVPTAFTMFPGDLVNAPRDFAARFFDIRS